MIKKIFKLSILFLIVSCGNDKKVEPEIIQPKKEKIIKEFGFTLNNFEVKKDTIDRGDSFGLILEKNELYYPKIFNIVNEVKKVFDIRRVNVGRPYTILYSKDSIRKPEYFIYQPSSIDYLVVSLGDSIYAEKKQKEVKLVEYEASGVIKSSLSETMQELGLSPLITNELSEIYAWNIDFFRLEKGDNFKILYTSKFIDDSIYIGLDRVHNSYFEHRGKPFYAIEYETDSVRGITEYFDENGKNLRRAFLQSPIKFGRISSRYNLRRRIAYYGNRVRPHRGTDFAAPVGTPILSTANGTITEVSYTRANGRYVKVKHNNTYTTQYLHMQKANVKVGQFVEQGDVIGFVGMTGNTSGPHVCYRFRKNDVEVDPFKQELPEAKPINESLKKKYFSDIVLIKSQLDSIVIRNKTSI